MRDQRRGQRRGQRAGQRRVVKGKGVQNLLVVDDHVFVIGVSHKEDFGHQQLKVIESQRVQQW